MKYMATDKWPQSGTLQIIQVNAKCRVSNTLLFKSYLPVKQSW